MDLKDRIKSQLGSEAKTIPDLCKEFDITDENDMVYAIAELEYSGDAVLKSFDKVYREDGGIIYLAKYARSNS